jgi:hypothetical protein
MTEIAFVPASGILTDAIPSVDSLERISEVHLAPVADGPVQSETESRLLDQLREEIDAAMGLISAGEVLVVENQPAIDWPKTRETRTEVLEPLGNRFHFSWQVDPPLRLGRYRITP